MGGIYHGRHDVTEVVGASVAEVAHIRDHGELLVVTGGAAGDAAPQHDAISSAEPRINRELALCTVAAYSDAVSQAASSALHLL